MEQRPAIKKKQFVGLYTMPLDPTRRQNSEGEGGGAYDRYIIRRVWLVSVDTTSRLENKHPQSSKTHDAIVNANLYEAQAREAPRKRSTRV